MDVIRDKSYVEVDGMLFNVTGYEHPKNAVYASLKYVDRKKWKAGYAAACEWLRSNCPELIDKYIQVPLDRITKVYDPGQRWSQLQSQSSEMLLPLHREAMRLGHELSLRLDIPLTDFGITDSLLWGEGHDASDIDLIVYGSKHTNQILNRAPGMYVGDFQRPDPQVMTAPYSLDVEHWPAILARKLHMGSFRERLFSLRVVLSDADLNRKSELLFESESEKEVADIEFHIADTSKSLCFPAVYSDEQGNELVDYSVVYEGVFRVGEVVRARVAVERDSNMSLSRRMKRFVIEEVSCFF